MSYDHVKYKKLVSLGVPKRLALALADYTYATTMGSGGGSSFTSVPRPADWLVTIGAPNTTADSWWGEGAYVEMRSVVAARTGVIRVAPVKGTELVGTIADPNENDEGNAEVYVFKSATPATVNDSFDDSVTAVDVSASPSDVELMKVVAGEHYVAFFVHWNPTKVYNGGTPQGTVVNCGQVVNDMERSPGTLFEGSTYVLGDGGAAEAPYAIDPLLNSISFGKNLARGESAHAEGLRNDAAGQFSHAEGTGNRAWGLGSHAEGSSTKATGNPSHAEGTSTIASGASSHAEGTSTEASGGASHAEGHLTLASGLYSHAEGETSHATANGAHAEGAGSIASGDSSHAEGGGSTASGPSAHAEGISTSATGAAAHASGAQTHADGDYSTTEGFGTRALTQSSHASGHRGTATRYNEWVHGDGDDGSTPVAAWHQVARAPLNPDGDSNATAGDHHLDLALRGAHSLSVRARVQAVTPDGSIACEWDISALVVTAGGVARLVGAPAVVQTFADAGASGWTLTLSTLGDSSALRFQIDTGTDDTNRYGWADLVEGSLTR